MKTALIIGATGLVGSELTKKLLNDNRYDKVKVFVRRTTGISNPKFEEHIVDFDNIETWKNELTGDELYSALGTTIKKAGSKKAQYKIDFHYQFAAAKSASENGVNKYLLISSIGANSNSKNFYLNMKGNLDDAVQQFPFQQIMLFRPSILVGERNEKRIGESLGIKIAGLITNIIPAIKKYRPIKASKLAEAMITSANLNFADKFRIFESEEIFNL
ncbi:MAG TPA: NADH-quinone oxidoreductase subunit F [Ignavibacteriales bacterium]|nr:NADH-quinone oxidoreductase subunit F [Ignavibacteriales bacterium]